MASPFPGMDPYLEQFWGDVHQAMITYARDFLQGVLPGDLRARMQERVFVESEDETGRNIFPDIRIVERGRGRQPAASTTTVAIAEPLSIRVPDDPATQGFIEIIDLTTGRKVVTVIEVLSPANKVPGQGMRLYRHKQRECKHGQVNLVEIDLLRAGSWVLSVPEDYVAVSYRTKYRVCVFRADRSWWDFYKAPLRERLPVIGIPLREKDCDVPLDLQGLLAQCYEKGGYDDDIDYQADPVPPLTGDDGIWADALLLKQRRRAAPSRKKENGKQSSPRKNGPRKRKP